MPVEPRDPVTTRWSLSRTRQRRARSRRGGATGSALTIAALFATLTTAAIIVGPTYLRADDGRPTDQPAAIETHQQVIDTLAALIGRSVEVLAIHQATGSSYTELVLWLEDREAPGRIDAPEIAVISHSAVLHAIWFYTIEPTDDDALDVALPEANAATSAPTDWRWSDMQQPTFCTAWRHRPDIQRRLIASGVSRLNVERLTRSDSRRVLLRIALTWSADSSDGPDRASLVLDAIMRRETDA
jgi:hypothetical protein